MALDIGDKPISTSNSSSVSLLGIQGGTKAVIVSPYVLPSIVSLYDLDGGQALIVMTPLLDVDGGDSTIFTTIDFDAGGSV